jgi:hypothetical protein
MQEVKQEIGHGGYGAVLIAVHSETGLRVAIKVQTVRQARSQRRKGRHDAEPEGESVLSQEISMLSRLDHPNIVRYIEAVSTAARRDAPPVQGIVLECVVVAPCGTSRVRHDVSSLQVGRAGLSAGRCGHAWKVRGILCCSGGHARAVWVAVPARAGNRPS